MAENKFGPFGSRKNPTVSFFLSSTYTVSDDLNTFPARLFPAPEAGSDKEADP